MRKLSMDELGRKTVEEFKAADKTPIVLVLDNIRSMHNVGSVFRTADAFLLQGIVLCGYTPVPPHRDINKTALGATETVEWQYFDTTMEAVKALKDAGYQVMAIEQAVNSQMLDRFKPPAEQPLALVFGNEVSGVDAAVMAGRFAVELMHLAGAVLDVPARHRGGVHLDQHLVGTRRGHRVLAVHQLVGPAELVQPDGFHDLGPRLRRAPRALRAKLLMQPRQSDPELEKFQLDLVGGTAAG